MIIDRLFRLLAKVSAKLIEMETRQMAWLLRRLEAQASRELAERLALPVDSVVFTVHPVPKVELKVPVSPEKLAFVEEFLDQFPRTPKINSAVRTGLH